MTAKNLKKIEFRYDPSAFDLDHRGHIIDRKLSLEVDRVLRSIFILGTYINNELKNQKTILNENPVHTVVVNLSMDPNPELHYWHSEILYVDIHYDPRELAKLPNDREVLGKVHLTLLNMALDKLDNFPGFPCDALRRGRDNYVENHYSYSFMAGKKMVPETKIMGVVGVCVTPAETIRYFRALYRNKPLFQVEISRNENPDFMLSRHFSGFGMNGTVLTINGGQVDPFGNSLVPDVQIDFADYPEVMELMLAKGWGDVRGTLLEPRRAST